MQVVDRTRIMNWSNLRNSFGGNSAAGLMNGLAYHDSSWDYVDLPIRLLCRAMLQRRFEDRILAAELLGSRLRFDSRSRL